MDGLCNDLYTILNEFYEPISVLRKFNFATDFKENDSFKIKMRKTLKSKTKFIG